MRRTRQPEVQDKHRLRHRYFTGARQSRTLCRWIQSHRESAVMQLRCTVFLSDVYHFASTLVRRKKHFSRFVHMMWFFCFFVKLSGARAGLALGSWLLLLLLTVLARFPLLFTSFLSLLASLPPSPFALFSMCFSPLCRPRLSFLLHFSLLPLSFSASDTAGGFAHQLLCVATRSAFLSQ